MKFVKKEGDASLSYYYCNIILAGERLIFLFAFPIIIIILMVCIQKTWIFSFLLLIQNYVYEMCVNLNSSVIRQKGESQNGCFKKLKHGKFSEKRIFLTPWYAHVRVHIKG